MNNLNAIYVLLIGEVGPAVKHRLSTSLRVCPRLPWNSELSESWSNATTSILNNIWYMGKGRCCWEGKVNTSIVLTDLFCNETELCPGHTLVWYNPGIGRFQLPQCPVCVCVHSARLTLHLYAQTDCSPPGSSVHRILRARILEQVAISSSRGSSQSRDRALTSCAPCTSGRLFTAEPAWKPAAPQQHCILMIKPIEGLS